MKKFNINNFWYIRITPEGWNHLAETVEDSYMEHCILSHMVRIDGIIWVRLQCHEIMNLFPLVFGKSPLYNTNVLIDDQDLE